MDKDLHCELLEELTLVYVNCQGFGIKALKKFNFDSSLFSSIFMHTVRLHIKYHPRLHLLVYSVVKFLLAYYPVISIDVVITILYVCFCKLHTIYTAKQCTPPCNVHRQTMYTAIQCTPP